MNNEYDERMRNANAELSKRRKAAISNTLTVLLVITVFTLMFLRNCTGIFKKDHDNQEIVKIDINKSQAVLSYIEGKWSWEKYVSANETWRYRFEIIGNKIKIWTCVNNVKDPFIMDEYEEFNFELGEPTRDVDGYNCRYLVINEFNNDLVSLGLRSISPIWVVIDDYWKTPVIRCGSGIPVWDKAEFQSAGTNISQRQDVSDYNSESNNYSNESSSNYENEPTLESETTSEMESKSDTTLKTKKTIYQQGAKNP